MNIETEQAAAVSNKIPFTKESTTIEKPTLSVDPKTGANFAAWRDSRPESLLTE